MKWCSDCRGLNNGYQWIMMFNTIYTPEGLELYRLHILYKYICVEKERERERKREREKERLTHLYS